MKKVILATGLASILTIPAFASTKTFVGLGVGFAGPVLNDNINDAIDDDLFDDDSGTASLNLTAGIRFGNRTSIYNGGLSATLSYMPDLVHLTNGTENPFYMDATMDLTTLYISYDNYIRLSGNSKTRTDFIASVGIGHGWTQEKATILDYEPETTKDDGLIVTLKFGFGGETMIRGLGWTATASLIGLNADKDADLQGAYSLDFGLKYTF